MALQLNPELARAFQGRPAPRVTLVRAGGLGDTLLTLPAADVLVELVPDAELTLIGSAWAERLLPLLPRRPAFVRFDSPALTPLFRPGADGDPTGALAKADAVVVYAPQPGDALARNARRLSGACVVEWPVHPAPGRHAACHFAAAVCDGEPQAGDLPFAPIRVPADLRARADEWLSERFGATAVASAVHPGSGGRAKCWPAERFAELIQRLDGPVVLLQGPADDEPCDRVLAALPRGRPVVCAAGLSVAQAAALVSRCRLFVGNDSGLSHLAAAVGTPTVAVFGPTDPAVWAPHGPRVRTCRGEPWPDVETVLAAAAELAP